MARIGIEWRHEVPFSDRIKVRQHIMEKFRLYDTTMSEFQIKSKSLLLESYAFSQADSRRGYLEILADGLTKLQLEASHSYIHTSMMPNDTHVSFISDNHRTNQVPHATRIEARQDILEELRLHHKHTPEYQLNTKAVNLESQVFSQATTIPSYFTNILMCLRRIATDCHLNAPRRVSNGADMYANASFSASLPVGMGFKRTRLFPEQDQIIKSDQVPKMSSSADWRDEMPRDDRVKVCQHIMGKLQSHYTNVPEDQLKGRTSAFESQAFSKATSRRDYLERIAEGLSKVEAEGRRRAQPNGVHGDDGGAVSQQ